MNPLGTEWPKMAYVCKQAKNPQSVSWGEKKVQLLFLQLFPPLCFGFYAFWLYLDTRFSWGREKMTEAGPALSEQEGQAPAGLD